MLREFMSAWSMVLPHHRLFDDARAIELIVKHFPENQEYVDIYRSIGVPSAKSDVFRYLELHESGGIYLDVHFGFVSEDKVLEFLLAVDGYDAVVVDNGLGREMRPDAAVLLINGLVLCKRNHPLLLAAGELALRNLRQQREKEDISGFAPYDVWELTGAGVLNSVFFDVPFYRSTNGVSAFSRTAGNIKVVKEEELPIKRNMFGAYRRTTRHWSERQNTEPLFNPAGQFVREHDGT